MSITCAGCGHENPDEVEFCEVCGAELVVASVPVSSSPPVESSPPSITQVTLIPSPPVEQPGANEPSPAVSVSAVSTIAATTARLIAKQSSGSSAPEFPLDGSTMIVGRFDPDTGPVDIDLEGLPGEETVSRPHAEICMEGGQWKINDLTSTNGTFIRRVGNSRFGARLASPEVLNPGDEVAFGKVRFVFQSP